VLQNTFRHIKGIGPIRERALWRAGILHWDDYEAKFRSQGTLFPRDEEDVVLKELALSRRAFAEGDFDFFAERLPTHEHFRIALTDPGAVLFLDIETTGLSWYYDHITLIGLAMSDQHFVHIRGRRPRALREFVAGAKCLVTFNGTMFDLRFLAQEFPDLALPAAHVDLRFLAKRVGLTGGQKAIEDRIGFARPADAKAVKGERAPLLWHEYRLGDVKSAKLLIRYNKADVDGMRALLDHAIRQCLSGPDYQGLNLRPPSFAGKTPSLAFASTPRNARKNRIFVPSFKGRRGPLITYGDLTKGCRMGRFKVVGIDLTGSEARPSGWCLLKGSHATTRRLATEEEIVRVTLAARPTVVSIDSPLSLPDGRTRVTDDDPTRKTHGITRHCERELKRRGVNVYPCLIQSMQRLTERGIRLAATFRAHGLPVIESYPGAAQDVMNIPRKRAGLDYLKKGLADFGLRGQFVEKKVSHDELDAVTAALVADFFWSGKSEALGNEDEDYLIIPDLRVQPESWRTRVVVGISGPIAAGKTTAAEHLQSLSFSYGRYSLVLADLLRERGEEVTRDALQELGVDINKHPGQRWLCKRLASRFGPASSAIVIDGLRHPEDHAFLVEHFGPAFFHVHLVASDEIRLARYRGRGGSLADFRAADKHPAEKQVTMLSELAHATLVNQGSINELDNGLAEIIEEAFPAFRGELACR
jgi:uncharacterized protein YprB with RNaseH-like and TPR domain/predicted nuclease with RNAse H fold/dephospho-CoA kinase